jgi:hypothetical protein
LKIRKSRKVQLDKMKISSKLNGNHLEWRNTNTHKQSKIGYLKKLTFCPLDGFSV